MLDRPERYYRPEAQIVLPGIRVMVGDWFLEEPYEAVFAPKDVHVVCLHVTKRPSMLKGRCLRDGVIGDYGNVGEIIFAPARHGLYQKSTGSPHPQRTIECEIAADAFGELGVLLPNGIDQFALKACLDLRLDHLRRSMLRLASEACAPNTASDLLTRSLVGQIYVDAMRYLRDVRDPSHAQNATLAPHQLHRIDEILSDFSHGIPTVSRLASALGVSREHLSRRFKATTGQSIHAHLAVIRLNRAKEMLSQTGMPVKVIAHRLGFSSHSAFSVAFRNETGISPRQFRHQFSTPI